MKHFLKNQISWIWDNLENRILFLFFLTFPFNVRKVFLTPFSYLNGGFNEYLTIFFSWADFLIIALIAIYAIKYMICQCGYYGRQRTVGNDQGINNHLVSSSPFILTSVSRETFVLLILLFWISLSILWAPLKEIAAFRILQISSLVLFVYVITRLFARDNRIALFVTTGTILGGTFQSIIAISQFFLNHSLGLNFLGESILAPNLPGIAKIVINGEKHIRAYGTFPHPNILAGFLVVSIVFIVYYIIRDVFIRRNSEPGPMVSHGTIFQQLARKYLYIILVINLTALILSFSRSALIGLAIGIISTLIPLIIKISFGKKNYLTGMKIPLYIFALSILAVFFIFSLWNTSILSTQSLHERDLYINVSYEAISSNSAIGVGIGNFVYNFYRANPNLSGWQYQPVHNIYLLLMSEAGIVGFIIACMGIYMFHVKHFYGIYNHDILTLCVYCCIIVSFIFISFFDHYFWDIRIGMIVFSIPFAYLSTAEKK